MNNEEFSRPTNAEPNIQPVASPPPVTPPAIFPPSQQVQAAPPVIKKRRVLPNILALGAVLVVASAAILLLSSTRAMPTSLPEFSQDMLKKLESQYGYDITYDPDVSLDKTYSIPVSSETKSCWTKNTCADDFAVYTDAALTSKADAILSVQTVSGQETMLIKPPASFGVMDHSQVEADGIMKASDAKFKLAEDGRWGLNNAYYIVQRVDKNGNKLERPKVTLFTVRTTVAPSVATKVLNDGSVTFSWSPVENADNYYLVMLTREDSNISLVNNGTTIYNVLASTNKTSVNLAEYSGEKAQAEKAASSATDAMDLNMSDKDYWSKWADSTRYFQNQQLSVAGLKSEDSLYDTANSRPTGSYDPTSNGMPAVKFAVVAAKGSNRSAIQPVDGTPVMAEIPYGLANNASNQMYGSTSSYYNDCYVTHTKDLNDCYYELMPIQMADGHTALKPVLYDIDSVQSNGKSGIERTTVFTYRVQGTLITSKESTLDDDIAAVKATLTKINKRNLAAYGDMGAKDIDVIYAEAGAKLPEKQASDSVNSSKDKSSDSTNTSASDSLDTASVGGVSIPINGSTPLVKYIAKSLLEGKTSFYTDTYQAQDPTVSLKDALHEAVYQNPYTQLMTGTSYQYRIYDNGIELVSASDGGRDASEIATAYSKVKQVDASIIKAGMSDREKALAINQWIVNNATYDNAAFSCMQSDSNDCMKDFPYAWIMLGTLSHGTGVCDSYSDTFKALADEAGLQSVWVSGVVTSNGGLHAWNKVFMDGKWQIVDVTWDDSSSEAGGSATKYFGITDAASDRTQADDFVIDRLVATYAAN